MFLVHSMMSLFVILNACRYGEMGEGVGIFVMFLLECMGL